MDPISLEEVKRNYVTAGHPTAYSGRTFMKRFYKNQLTAEQIDTLLTSIYSYGLHREYKKPAVRNPFYVYHIRHQIQMDLIQLERWSDISLPRHNDGIRFLCVAIDAFTRFAWVVPMKNKSATQSLAAIKAIMTEMKESYPFRYPKSVLVDRGTEYNNQYVKTYFQNISVNLYHPNNNTVKAGIAERFNRTLQNLIFKFMTQKETNCYITALPSLLKTYNSRGHRSIGNLSPFDAEEEENQSLVLQYQVQRFEKIRKKRKLKATFKLGDIVRILVQPVNRFRRGYHHQFSADLFRIHEIRSQMPIHMYIVQSMNTNEVLRTRFYKEQLQLFTGEVYRIEKVLRQRVRRGKRECFVKWMYFTDDHNSWISAENLEEIA